MNNPKNQNNISRYVKLEDYKVFDYEIPEIFLDFVIKKNAVNVTTKLKLVKKNKNTRNLILDGTDILIKNIFIDDSLLEEEYYKQQKNNLKIKNINKDNFLLKIEGIIKPKENISELKPGAFININWNKKKLMLPYSLRKDYISFTDKKWDWRYQFNKEGSPDINNPSLYELLPSGKVKAHYCHSEDKSSNL